MKKIIKILLIIVLLILIFSVMKVNAINNIPNPNIEKSNGLLKISIITYTLISMSNLGVIVDIFVLFSVLIITLIKKYKWKTFKICLIIFILLLLFNGFVSILLSGQRSFEDVNFNTMTIYIDQICFYIIKIIISLVLIIYPIIAIKKINKQISLKGENKNV